MRNALTAFISAASFCAIATAATAQDATMYPYPYPGAAPTSPSTTGAPLYSYHYTGPQPAAVGSCQIIAGNRVCDAGPAASGYGYAPNYGYAPGYGYGGPIGAVVAAPFEVAGGLVTAPFGAFGAPVATTGGATYAPATGTPVYSYESQVPPQPGAVGHCDLLSGNHVCFPTPP
jgi:hypothetical protein